MGNLHCAGHFRLTNLLLEKMKRTAKTTGVEGRIVNLSSIAHVHTYEHGIRFEKINDRIGYVLFSFSFFRRY
jgi:retinol dehydrogenase-12